MFEGLDSKELGMGALVGGQFIALLFFVIKGFIDKKFKKQEMLEKAEHEKKLLEEKQALEKKQREEIRQEVEFSEIVKGFTEMRMEIAELKGQMKLLVTSIYQVGKLEKDVTSLFQKLRTAEEKKS